MNCSPTLSAEEFKVLHNSLWELGNIDNPRVQQLVEQIRTVALKGAYEQDHTAFETKHDYYAEYQRGHSLRSIWSIFDLPVGGFDQVDPFKGVTHLVYKDHWGEDAVVEEIKGPTWGDLYRAADAAIRKSGDDHHIFIEHFYTVAEQPHQLRLTTGS